MQRSLPLVGLALLSASGIAQESRTQFDAPTIVFSSQRRVEEIADINGDGLGDALSLWWKDGDQEEFRIT